MVVERLLLGAAVMQTRDASYTSDPGDQPAEGALLSRGLGWFSIALGATELIAPRPLARLVGLRPSMVNSVAIRLLGVRELATGVYALLSPRRAIPIWARVAGDAVDISLLVLGAMTNRRTKPVRV